MARAGPAVALVVLVVLAFLVPLFGDAVHAGSPSETVSHTGAPPDSATGSVSSSTPALGGGPSLIAASAGPPPRASPLLRSAGSLILANDSLVPCSGYCVAPTVGTTASSMVYDSRQGTVFVGDPRAGDLFDTQPSHGQILWVGQDLLDSAYPPFVAGPELAYSVAYGEVFWPLPGDNRTAVVNASDPAHHDNSYLPSTGAVDASVDPIAQEVFLSEPSANAIDVYSLSTLALVGTIVLTGPGWSAFDPANGDLYVLSAGSIAVIATSNLTEVGTVAVGGLSQILFDPGVNELFGVNPVSGNASVISTVNNTLVATVPLWAPLLGHGVGSRPSAALAYDPVDSEVFASSAHGVTTAIRDANNTVAATVPGTSGVLASSFVPANDTVWLGYGTGLIRSLWAANDSLGLSVPLYRSPENLVYDAAAAEIVASVHTPGADELVAMSGATGGYGSTVVLPAGFEVAPSGLGLAYDPGRSELFVANSNGSSVLALTGVGLTPVGTVPVGSNPTGIAYDPGQGELFVADTGANELTVVNDTNLSVVATVPVCGSPEGVAFDPTRAVAVVACPGSSSLDIVSATNNTLTGSVDLPSWTTPTTIVYDPVLGESIATDLSGSGRLYIVDDASATLAASFVTTAGADGGLASFGDVVLVPNAGGWSDEVVSPVSGRVVGYVPCAPDPTAIAFDPRTNVTFTASAGDGLICVDVPVGFDTTVHVHEVGLPTGRSWGVVAGYPSVSVNSTTTSLTLPATAYATVPYTIVAPSGWGVRRVVGLGGPTQYSFNTSNSSAFTIAFAPLVSVYFNESALPSFRLYAGASWSVALSSAYPSGGSANLTANTTGASIRFVVPAGEPFRFVLTPPSMYVALPSHGAVHVPVRGLSLTVRFRLVTDPVVFHEGGLARGASWTVTITTSSSPAVTAPISRTVPAGASIRFALPVGTYQFTVTSTPSQIPTGFGSSVTVSSAPGTPVVVWGGFS